MKMQDKHKSKLLRGFEKQIIRQDNKPNEVKIKLPIAIKLPKNFKGKYKHTLTVSNSKWNGMNLKNLRNWLVETQPNTFNSKFYVNVEGMYKLSMRGKQNLNKKRQAKKLKNKLG